MINILPSLAEPSFRRRLCTKPVRIFLTVVTLLLSCSVLAKTPSQQSCGLMLAKLLGHEIDASAGGRVAARHQEAITEMETLAELRAHLAKISETAPPSVLTFEDLKKIWQAVVNHPVAALCHLPEYDPRGHIGFCFGRAAAAHFEAVLRRADEQNIKKLFINGRLRVPGEFSSWGFHSTTIVRLANNQWYSLDPRNGGPIEIGGWAAYWMRFGKTSYFSVGEPDIIYPDGTRYDEANVFQHPSSFDPEEIKTAEYMRKVAQHYLEKINALEEWPRSPND